MKKETDKISIIEKIGYSLGDFSANLIFQTLMTFIAFFYTDVFQIPPASASAIIFIGGMIGAFFNPVMGVIADRTNTRWGKFRPWILWTAVPFAAISIITFSTPNLSIHGKTAYAFITYVLLVLVYSANNLPYASLSGVMTGNMAERNSISSYRFIAVTSAQFIIQVILLPLVMILGDGDKTVGFEKAMTIFAITGAIFFIITFLTTRERIVPKPEQKSSVKEDLGDLIKNKPWIAMLILTVFIFITLSLRGGVSVYYFKDFLSEEHLSSFLQNIGFNSFIENLNNSLQKIGLIGFQWPEDAATSGFSLFNAAGIIFMMIGIGVSKKLADKYGKRDVFGFGLFITAICFFSFVLFSSQNIGMLFIAQILHGFFYGITIPLLWAMIADVADFSEVKTNRRATAIIFSAMIFGLKTGLSIGGGLVAGILAFFNYDEQLVFQAGDTVRGIKLTMGLFPAITLLISVACLFFYEIDKRKEMEIERELLSRREKNEQQIN